MELQNVRESEQSRDYEMLPILAKQIQYGEEMVLYQTLTVYSMKLVNTYNALDKTLAQQYVL